MYKKHIKSIKKHRNCVTMYDNVYRITKFYTQKLKMYKNVLIIHKILEQTMKMHIK